MVTKVTSNVANLVSPTITTPVITGGTVYPSGTPCFRAFPSAVSSGANHTFLNYTKTFDKTTAFDVSTGKFQPAVAGIYYIAATVQVDSAVAFRLAILKNGTAASYGARADLALSSSVSGLIEMNGTTDYVQLQIIKSVAATSTQGEAISWFEGNLVRAA